MPMTWSLPINVYFAKFENKGVQQRRNLRAPLTEQRGWQAEARHPHALQTYGLMLQTPRPCVPAYTVWPFGPISMSLTEAFGRLVPSLDQLVEVPPPSFATKAPASVARTSLPPIITMASPGMSGRSPEISVQLLPPFVVSNTWPMPPPGIQRRL